MTYSSAETAYCLVNALIEIKAPKTAEICRKALALVFPNGLPATAQEISAQASHIDKKTASALCKLDKEFCTYPHDLTELLYDFVISHPEEFMAQYEMDGVAAQQEPTEPLGLLKWLKSLFRK